VKFYDKKVVIDKDHKKYDTPDSASAKKNSDANYWGKK